MNARVSKPQSGEAQPVLRPVPDAIGPAANEAAPPAPKKRNGRRLVLMVSVPLILLVAGGYFWLMGGRFVDTDNAYVQQAKVSLSADISGRVIGVSVRDNQNVKAGEVLFTIDPAPYQIALDQANAALAAAKVNVEQLRVAYGTAQAKLTAAQATLDIRQHEYDRKQSLATQGITADAALDDVKIALQAAQTNVSLAQQELASTSAALGGDPNIKTEDHPAVRTAMAALDNAQRNLKNTTVIAPADGTVSQVANLNVGQFVSTGTTIASLVETGRTWVQANFKETQLTGFVPGMPAEITVDAYPGVKFEGKVASIGAATGSEFSLIPAQNATGNWVKVVQRIPVRIELTDAGDKVALRTGMSAGVTVDTGKTTLDKMH